ncbi:MAG: aquaporin [Saprospiraceae bacterium]|jgi:aquaporin Z|nr:aquaporin [Saprospiraceae bacterium]MBP9211028.1 aquaporin [Saprospiraceae bacterium]MBV6473123.1 Aquaporin Z [Saprospiraceae bacterium]
MKLNKLVVECIGTFFLVLVVNMCALGNAGTFTPIAAGFILVAMIFAGGHVSGAHYNPAVTLAVFLRGKCSAADVPSYIFAQLLGASVASLLASAFFLDKMGPGMDLSMTVGQALMAELLGTFALCWVVLNVATAQNTSGNSFYGLAIGAVIVSMAYAFGPVSGAAFNPAVALSLGVSNLSGFNNFWIYLIGEILGAVLAAYAFIFANGKE